MSNEENAYLYYWTTAQSSDRLSPFSTSICLQELAMFMSNLKPLLPFLRRVRRPTDGQTIWHWPNTLYRVSLISFKILQKFWWKKVKFLCFIILNRRGRFVPFLGRSWRIFYRISVGIFLFVRRKTLNYFCSHFTLNYGRASWPMSPIFNIKLLWNSNFSPKFEIYILFFFLYTYLRIYDQENVYHGLYTDRQIDRQMNKRTCCKSTQNLMLISNIYTLWCFRSLIQVNVLTKRMHPSFFGNRYKKILHDSRFQRFRVSVKKIVSIRRFTCTIYKYYIYR